VVAATREFTLPATGVPAPRGNGNGHRDTAAFPWGGEDR
jgi:hypothetical protein